MEYLIRKPESIGPMAKAMDIIVNRIPLNLPVLFSFNICFSIKISMIIKNGIKNIGEKI